MSRLRLRGGFVGGETAPPDYGPTNEKDWVIANVGPRSVSRPSGAIDISPPGGLTQAVLDAAASDAVFWLLPGTHTSIRGTWDTGLVPKSGQTIAAPSDGSCTIDGGGWASGVGRGGVSATNSTNVTIRGGTWTNYGWTGAYAWHSPFHLGPGWVLEDANVTGNAQSGTHRGGVENLHGLIVRYCNLVSNGRYGSAFGGNGSGDPALNVIFEHNYVYNNNTAHYDTGDDAGGSKWFYIGNGSAWRYNYFTGNYGFDCWFDTGCMDVTIEESVFEKTRGSDTNWWAPFHWEDCGPGVFHRNHVTLDDSLTNYPGGLENAGVRFVSCDGQRYSNSIKKEFEIVQNIIDTDGWIPALVSWPAQPTGGGGYRVNHRSIWTHHNDFYIRRAASGMVGTVTSTDRPAGLDTVTGRDIRYYTNRYNLASLSSSYWEWDPPSYNTKTWTQWQGTPYFADLDSTRVQL